MIESIFYEEQYINLGDPSLVDTVDSYIIKSSGEIIRNLNGDKSIYICEKDDFTKLEKEIVEFIDKADCTVCFIDNMKVSIIIAYENGIQKVVERGLSCEEEFLDALILDYIDCFVGD